MICREDMSSRKWHKFQFFMLRLKHFFFFLRPHRKDFNKREKPGTRVIQPHILQLTNHLTIYSCNNWNSLSLFFSRVLFSKLSFDKFEARPPPWIIYPKGGREKEKLTKGCHDSYHSVKSFDSFSPISESRA